MASHTKSQPNSGINRRWLLAGAAGGAMLPVAAHAVPPKPKKRGVWLNPRGGDDDNLVDKVADFSYQNDALAQLIVDTWKDLYPDLLAGVGTPQQQYQQRSSRAKAVLEDRGIYLTQPIVITEDEYDQGFSLADAGLPVTDGVVLVVPRKTRATMTTATGPAPPLLETAKMLMAVTPNGI
ncbi:hypothetical protein [Bradyrhizobium sp. CCBAU 051011]|uniref:hypothetical protein n=1 Tax=Bradyrhizobium sp. CCBAU 051011 TaxID=858422 RepID=UPI00137A4B32|nr:hypothetical protein [Bradyrhizobium sp. CCBAU 051011]